MHEKGSPLCIGGSPLRCRWYIGGHVDGDKLFAINKRSKTEHMLNAAQRWVNKEYLECTPASRCGAWDDDFAMNIQDNGLWQRKSPGTDGLPLEYEANDRTCELFVPGPHTQAISF